jgi:hypothetical protein
MTRFDLFLPRSKFVLAKIKQQDQNDAKEQSSLNPETFFW